MRVTQLKFSTTFLVELAIIFAWTAEVSVGEIKLDQEYIPPNDIGFSDPAIFYAQDFSQVFTVGQTGTLTDVDLYLTNYYGAANSDLLMDIRPTQSGLPFVNNNSAIATGRVIASSVPVSPTVSSRNFGFVSVPGLHLQVTAGEKLAIVLHSIDHPSLAGYAWGATKNTTVGRDPYAGGDGFSRDPRLSGGNSDWRTAFPYDTGFKTFVDVKNALPSELATKILDHSVTWDVSIGNTRGIFTPGMNLTPKEAATALGFDHFNWIQVITRTSERDLNSPEVKDVNGLPPSQYFSDGTLKPFFDPIAGGYAYQHLNGEPASQPVQDSLPYYWDEKYQQGNISLFTNDSNTPIPISFWDPDFSIPAHSVYFGDYPNTLDETDFTTNLVGVRTDGSAVVLNFDGNGLRWHESGGKVTRFSNPGDGQLAMTFSDGIIGANEFTATELNAFASAGLSVAAPQSIPEPGSVTLIISGVAVISLNWLRRRATRTS